MRALGHCLGQKVERYRIKSTIHPVSGANKTVKAKIHRAEVTGRYPTVQIIDSNHYGVDIFTVLKRACVTVRRPPEHVWLFNYADAPYCVSSAASHHSAVTEADQIGTKQGLRLLGSAALA